jgi:putative aldouronate transport system substrate-binding protein
MKNKTRVFLTGLFLLLAAGMVFAGGGNQRATAVPASASGGPFYISIMCRQSTAEPATTDNAVIKEIERITNTKLDITWASQAAYPEKLAVTVASNDYPMLTLFEFASPTVMEIEAVRAGLFWKVGDYIKDPQYKWLQELDADRITNASIDGELWGMYRTRPLVRNGLYYRKDWADKLGLTKPKNGEELYQMVKAFVQNDPDGNGRNDTYGIGQEAYLRNHFATLSPLFGLGNGWDIIDGKLTAVHTRQGYLDMLKYIKRFYDEGLMNRDFPTYSEDKRNELLANNYGMAITSIEKGQQSIVPLQKLHPNATFEVMTDFEGYPLIGRSGYDSKFYISKKAVPNEADVRRIVKYFDDMHSPEINNLIYNGIENVHYTRAGGNEITVNTEQRAKYIVEVEPVTQLGFQFRKNNYTLKDAPYYQAQVDYYNNIYEVPLINDPTWVLTSDTRSENGNELEQFIWDSGVQFITGAIDERGWWAAVDRWRKDGGDKMTAEYQAGYDAVQKNK